MMFLAFLASIVVFAAMLSLPADSRRNVVDVFTWIPAGRFQVQLGFLADPFSVTWILFVTGIATLIHVYSIGYMHGDPRFSRFFAYLNFFVAAMLVLVLGSSYLVTFLGWEGVGLASYLLISFWFERESAAVAGKKAFVTNRIGDFGFMVAMFLIFATVGTLDYGVSGAAAGSVAGTTATAIALLLFLGAIGKSAQGPLYVWLAGRDGGPDAGLGAHPRGDDGHRRRLPRRPGPPVLRGERRRDDGRRVGRGDHRALRRDDRHRAGRPQAGAGVLDHQPARLHVPRPGRRRVRRRGLHGDRARLLQGHPVPRRRIGDPRQRRQPGHAHHGRATEVHAGHRVRDGDRVARDRGDPTVLRLLGQGRDPREQLLRPRLRRVDRRHDRRRVHRVLHDAVRSG